MNKIFIIVRDFLLYLSSISRFTYNEINIIAYYYIIPAFYIFLIDYKLDTHFFKIIFFLIILCSFLFINNFKKFSDLVFIKSVLFLKWFKIIGLNYIASSVIICVFIPIIILILLLSI